jgi:hypothetical protein
MTKLFRTSSMSTNATPSERDGARSERLQYLADMAAELRAMAEAGECGMLAGLLALAHLEALNETRRTRPSLAA